jgi:hypothetical protein
MNVTTALLLSLMLTRGHEVPVASHVEPDRQSLLRNVRAINATGLPGPVGVFGQNAFAVITGMAGKDQTLPLVAATRYGRGRVVALGKPEFFRPDSLQLADTGQLLVNALCWAAGDKNDILVGVDSRVRGHGKLIDYLRSCGLTVAMAQPPHDQRFDVLCVVPSRCTVDEIDPLRTAVELGQGLIVAELGWGWLQLNPGKTLAADHLGNRLCASMGLIWLDGTLDRTSDDGYAATVDDTTQHGLALLNASHAFSVAATHESDKNSLTIDEIRQIGVTLTRTIQALPSNDAILMPAIATLTATAPGTAVPTVASPLQRSDILARLALTRQLRQAQDAAPQDIEPHPAAADFPGSVSQNAPRVTRTLKIDTGIPRWHSTGLYAAPGETIAVQIPGDAIGAGLKIRIGSTTCRNWKHAKWSRAPEITREFEIRDAKTIAACAFGGLVYVVVPQSCSAGTIDVSIAGAVESPLFILGRTTSDQWQRSRQRAAPWAELASSKAILTVPSEHVRSLENPDELMRVWDRILDLSAELAAWPSNDRRSPERYVADVQLCAGYMHAGYPIMIPTSAAHKLVDSKHLTTQGNWGLFHETGHNHQHSDWTFGGTVEVTCNLFTMYIYERLCGVAPEQGRMKDPKIHARVEEYFRAGPRFAQWKRDPFLALVMYYQLQQEFGWSAFHAVFKAYEQLKPDQRPADDSAKRDQWMTRFSRQTGRNLGPFFEAWGVPTSTAARSALQDLPTWMPVQFPPDVSSSE